MTDTTVTTQDGNSGTLLKTDRLGRVGVTAERRSALLEEFDRSGISAPQFAKLSGINYQTFATWLQKRRAAAGRQSGESTGFFSRRGAEAQGKFDDGIEIVRHCRRFQTVITAA